LGRLELDAGGGIALLPRGTGPLPGTDRVAVLAHLLAGDSRTVVADCGVVSDGQALVAPIVAARQSLLVIRPCYLALRRATSAPVHPSGVILLAEPGRTLRRSDVEQVVGAPVLAEVPWDPSVARAVDAGLLASRLPRALDRALRPVVAPIAA
jgi:hypothetical protein